MTSVISARLPELRLSSLPSSPLIVTVSSSGLRLCPCARAGQRATRCRASRQLGQNAGAKEGRLSPLSL